MPILRPSCQVRLQLYLDEGAKLVAPKPSAGSGAGLSLPGATDVAAKLESNATDMRVLGAIKHSLSPPSFEKARARLELERQQLEALQQGPTQKLPGGLDPSQGDDGAVIFTALPTIATMTRAPSKDADTAQIVFSFRDLPIDPRCIRSAFVAVTLGTVDREDYADGILNQRRRADKSLTSLIEHQDGQERRLHSSTRFVGYVAVWRIIFDESGDTVTLDCVDVSVVLRQQKLHGHLIDLTKPIDVGVQELIDSFPTSKGIRVIIGTPVGSEDEIQAPSGTIIPADLLPPVLKTRKGKVAKAQDKTEKMTVWDHITHVALRLGLIPVMGHFTLYLLEPRVRFRDLLNPVRMVYGNNVDRLELARKMEGITTDTIEVRCPDRSVGRMMWARYPVLSGEPKSGILGKPGSPQPTLSRASKVTPNGTGHEDVRVLTVSGVMHLATLEKIAESVFHEIGRQEISGSFSTHEIESFKSKFEADLLDLQPGDAVAILVAAQSDKPDETGANTLQQFQALSVAARIKYLEGLRISSKEAAKLAAAQEQARIQTAFRAGMVTIRWAAEEGIQVECDFFNFIVVREDPGSKEELGDNPKTLGAAMSKVK